MKYRTIVVDPPWRYRTAQMGAGRFGSYLAPPRILPKYDTLSVDALQALPFGDWAESDAHLYLWTTNALMEEAHQIVRAWGLDKKTIITWVKTQIGTGNYYRNTTEHALFAVKGSLRCLRSDVPTHFLAPRGRHSEKPAAFYDIVESMSPGPYLDVFARKLRFNWDAWGDEVGAPEGLPTPDEVRAMTKAGGG